MRRLAKDLSRLNRRGFLLGSAAAGGGLLLGFTPIAATGGEGAASPFESYLRIAPDGSVTVFSAHMEGGQGSYIGLATLVAEELGADWSRMRVEGAAGDTSAYGNLAWGGFAQGTGGSTAMASSWERYRLAGAAAREMLRAAAARRWQLPAAEIRLADGRLTHASGREAHFGALAAEAAAIAPPAPESLRLTPPEKWRLIGSANLRRLDTPAKTTGKQDYTIDVMLPGMLTAALARPPRFGGRAKRWSGAAARQIPGVVDIVETPRGIAVLAENTFSAFRGRDALDIVWDEAGAETRSTDALWQAYRDRSTNGPAALVRSEGDLEASLAAAERSFVADFEFPYLAHAAMEPLNAVARFADGRLEIWAGHQLPDLYQQRAADIKGIAPEQVTLHVMMTGGFFGRRATPDADVIVEVVSIVKALGSSRPVKVQWSREDDMRGGRYRPMYRHHLRTGLDETGMPSAWYQRIVGQSILAGTLFESALVHDGVDETSVEGAKDMPYRVPNLRLELATMDVGVPVLWWRSVGHTHTAYAIETIIDDLAVAAGVDPVAYRRKLLVGHPRHLGVMELAAERAGWGTALPPGRGRGIAVHKSFGTYVAQVAEVTAGEGGLTVDRVVCAVDCGIAVNPDIIRAQMEGGIGFGLGAALYGEITLDAGRVMQSNYHDFVCLRIDEMPQVEVYIVASNEPPTGVGEPGVPPIAPAVSNAIFAATGQRIRRLPMGAAFQ